MKPNRLHHLLILGTVLFIVLASPSKVISLERWLVPDSSQCAPDLALNPCHLTLADAVTQAAAGSTSDTIRIFPGTYPANVSITKNISAISGVETARTFLNGNGGAAITLSAVTTAIAIKNITFFNASPAILVQNGSTQVTIRNNIFEVAGSDTAISITDQVSSAVILNNTFFANGTAILSEQKNLSIINNIFSNNNIAISTNVLATTIKSNLFWQTGTVGSLDIILDSPGNPAYQYNATTQDPQFVNNVDNDITTRDFHLKTTTTATPIMIGDSTGGSNSIDSNPIPDIGAYGGSSSDTIPFPVSGLSGTVAGSSIALMWASNPCYMIQGYKVFYSANKSGDPYDTTQDAGNVTSFSLGPLTAPTSSITTAPVLSSSPGNGALILTWTPSSGATGYNIFYKETFATTYNPPIPVGNTTTYTLMGLTNPTSSGAVTNYDVYVQPFYQTVYHIAVKPYYNATDANKLALVYSNEISVPFGTLIDGPISNTITDFPEPIIAHPALPNSGCFIATAAYGSYSSSQVQALREFRDRYLLTSRPGRAFVSWYYTHGPRGAQFLNDHPEWKPIVRTALLPAVAMAMFLTHTSSLTKMLIVLLIGLSVVLLYHRKKPLPSGGVQ
jgi:hypothetical protein